MKRKVISIRGGIPRHPLYRLNKPVDFDLWEGEQIAIVGDNGSGKTLLVDILTGKHPLLGDQPVYDFGPEGGDQRSRTYVSDNLRYITFQDSYGTTDSTYYYQQRWNQHDVDGIPTAGEVLEASAQQAVRSQCIAHDYTPDEQEQLLRKALDQKERLSQLFEVGDDLLGKAVIFLSSGELRKLQLIKALLTTPRLLIIDNPFIGLDAVMRKQLSHVLHLLISETSTQLILVTPRTDEIPPYITRTVLVENKVVSPPAPNATNASGNSAATSRMDSSLLTLHSSLPSVVHLNHVTIRYGEHTILNDINWTVREGERWALTGRNGSGKSTLLSIVYADNLQAYAHDVTLFGRRRGTGESIWDIKRRIGYMSPEMHRAYRKNLPSLQIVASGLNDSIGLYAHPTPEQEEQCRDWLQIFSAEHLADRPFLTLSSGEQRLVLLARAFVKNPDLLILDEPFHGLDLHHRAHVRTLIEQYAHQPHKTLIMVTHYEEELPPCITRRLHLPDGTIS